MNDKDVPGMPDGLQMKTPAEGYRRYARNSYRLKQEAPRRYARRRAPFKEAASLRLRCTTRRVRSSQQTAAPTGATCTSWAR